MPYKAIDNRQIIDSKSHTNESIMPYWGRDLGCTHCPVFLHARRSRDLNLPPHFFHNGSHDCPATKISEWHLALQDVIEDAINAVDGWFAKKEYVHFRGKWRGDVVAIEKISSRIVPFEIQVSPMSLEVVLSRVDRHMHSGTHLTNWIITRDFSWAEKVPTARVYLNNWSLKSIPVLSFKVPPSSKQFDGAACIEVTVKADEYVRRVLEDQMVPRHETKVATKLNDSWCVAEFDGYLYEPKEYANNQTNSRVVSKILAYNQRLQRAVDYDYGNVLVK